MREGHRKPLELESAQPVFAANREMSAPHTEQHAAGIAFELFGGPLVALRIQAGRGGPPSPWWRLRDRRIAEDNQVGVLCMPARVPAHDTGLRHDVVVERKDDGAARDERAMVAYPLFP